MPKRSIALRLLRSPLAIRKNGHKAPADPQRVVQSMLDTASVKAVYGAPVKHGDSLVIPAAEVLAAGGFGFGSGEDAGGGGGGGGYVLSRPVAAIVMSPHSVRLELIVDATKIALAVFTTIGLVGTLLIRMLRPRR